MKVSPRTLKLMAAAAGTFSVSGGAWYAAEQAIAYDQRNYDMIMDEDSQAEEETTIVKVGHHVRDAVEWVGTKTGLIQPRHSCGPCGMG